MLTLVTCMLTLVTCIFTTPGKKNDRIRIPRIRVFKSPASPKRRLHTGQRQRGDHCAARPGDRVRILQEHSMAWTTTRAVDQTQMDRESASDDDPSAADMAVIDVLGSQVDPQDGGRSPADDQGPSSGKGRVGSEASRRSRAEAAEAAETHRLLTVDQIVPKSVPATDSAQRIHKVGHMHATCM
jgi:hypothetical protein